MNDCNTPSPAFLLPRQMWAAALETHPAARAQVERVKSAAPNVAVLSVTGVIVPFGPDEESGFVTSTEGFMAALRAACADDSCSSVLVWFHSPGGSTSGVQEAAAEIAELARVKPIIAAVNYLAASAAYWLASAMTRIVASPSSLIGSVGVFTEHVDISEMLEKSGVSVTGIAEPEDKLATTDTRPLSERGREELERIVNAYYEAFANDVSAFRSVSKDSVRRDFVPLLPSADALRVGMVDEVATLRATAAAMQSPSAAAIAGPSRRRAEMELIKRRRGG